MTKILNKKYDGLQLSYDHRRNLFEALRERSGLEDEKQKCIDYLKKIILGVIQKDVISDKKYLSLAKSSRRICKPVTGCMYLYSKDFGITRGRNLKISFPCRAEDKILYDNWCKNQSFYAIKFPAEKISKESYERISLVVKRYVDVSTVYESFLKEYDQYNSFLDKKCRTFGDLYRFNRKWFNVLTTLHTYPNIPEDIVVEEDERITITGPLIQDYSGDDIKEKMQRLIQYMKS